MRTLFVVLILIGGLLVATPAASAFPPCDPTLCIETRGDHGGGGDGEACVGFHAFGGSMGFITCQQFT